jgi:hypothetical protein
MGANEKMVKASVLSTGLNGGELLLTDWNDYVDATGRPVSAFDQLRSGQWIMMCGPHPNTSATEPRFVMNWYQVLAIDTALSGMTGYDPTKSQKVVSLRGPQWPWDPAASSSGSLCAAICRGAVAVHTKTMRLEGHGSAWSVSSGGNDGGFGNTGNPGQSPPPYSPY